MMKWKLGQDMSRKERTAGLVKNDCCLTKKEGEAVTAGSYETEKYKGCQRGYGRKQSGV